MYSTQPSFVLGFHGCDKTVVDAVLCENRVLKPSKNEYDWLGHGIYFWENDPERALLFARESAKRKEAQIEDPGVVGAVVDLGYCLNLIESQNLQLLKAGYQTLLAASEASGMPLPRNRNVGDADNDFLLRHLDCAVLETVHRSREDSNQRPFDSVRGVFWEGEELYPNAGFKEKNHVQLCVRNPNCIKGFFRVQESNSDYPVP